MKNFKEHFGIPKDETTEFLNIPLDTDIQVFIDPFLIANNRGDKLFNAVYFQQKAFLAKLNNDFILPNNRKDGLIFLDHLHEPNEYHLGYSGINKGSAIADTKAEVIFDSLRNNRLARASSLTITNEAHNVLLLVTGIGQDIMSDTIANVCRDLFAHFTKEQCLKYSISMSTFNRKFYDPNVNLWKDANFELPSYLGKPIILLPTKMMSSIRSYVNHYNYFVSSNCLSKDILSGKLDVSNPATFVKTLNDGTKAAIIKNIYKVFRKPKDELIQFVLDYNGSLSDFLDHAKKHYPSIEF